MQTLECVLTLQIHRTGLVGIFANIAPSYNTPTTLLPCPQVLADRTRHYITDVLCCSVIPSSFACLHRNEVLHVNHLYKTLFYQQAPEDEADKITV